MLSKFQIISRYWKSVHGNGKYAIWNCGLKWIIGKAQDMPNCLSWAESDYKSKVQELHIIFHDRELYRSCTTTAIEGQKISKANYLILISFQNNH